MIVDVLTHAQDPGSAFDAFEQDSHSLAVSWKTQKLLSLSVE